MERVSIFKPCELEYPTYDKPIRYTEEFLKQIADNTIDTHLVKDHYGKPIGNITNIKFTDGELYADVDSSHVSQKFSPSFDNLTLVEKDNYFLATSGKLVEVATTTSPRLDNSKDEGGSQMAENNTNDKTMEFLSKEVDRLQKENAKLEFKSKQDKEKLDKLSDYEKELEELRNWKETNEKIIEEQKPIVEAYQTQQKQAHEELLEKASRGNAEIKEQLKDCDNKTLETFINLSSQEQPAEGVSAENAPGLNDPSGEETDEKDKDLEDLKFAESLFNELQEE